MKSIYDWFAQPKNALKIHGWALIVWLILSVPIALFLSNSLPLIVFVSVYAIVISHWSSWQAARTELKQDKADAELRETVKRLRKFDPDHPD